MLSAITYMNHLRSYLNDAYIVSECGTGGGEFILKESYFKEGGARKSERRVRLKVPKTGIAFKLDQDQIKRGNKMSKSPLFHFLEDDVKDWVKRCDFVIFMDHGQNSHG